MGQPLEYRYVFCFIYYNIAQKLLCVDSLCLLLMTQVRAPSQICQGSWWRGSYKGRTITAIKPGDEDDNGSNPKIDTGNC